jgi:hypothetical protein
MSDMSDMSWGREEDSEKRMPHAKGAKGTQRGDTNGLPKPTTRWMPQDLKPLTRNVVARISTNRLIIDETPYVVSYRECGFDKKDLAVCQATKAATKVRRVRKV